MREICGFDAAVIGNCHGSSLRLDLHKIRSQTLCSLADGVVIHTVSTGTYNASESAGTELKLAVKSVVYFFFLTFHRFKFGLQVGVFCCFLQPKLVQCIDVHKIKVLSVFYSSR